MAREIFFTRNQPKLGLIEAAINFDESRFGTAQTHEADSPATPWTISIQLEGRDVGRLVGFEGDGPAIISMHQLKPDSAARRGCEITVFRMGHELTMNELDAPILSAFERWLLKRGWRGNVVKKMKFSNAQMVVPIRTFWVKNGYELVLAEADKWDEHVVKRWR